MKAIRKIGMWKAIAFLTVVISMFSCTSCDPEISLKPQVTIGTAEKVSQTAATLVASVIPNDDNVVISFEYQANNSAWKSQALAIKLSGSKAIKVTLDLSDLQPSTSYNFKVTAVSTAGSVTSSVSSFTTNGLTLAVVKIKSAGNVKISTASLSASVVPNQDNTSISFEYQTANSTWVSKSLGSTFSGTDSAKVSLDLSDLKANTLYNFRVRVSNKAGEVVSAITSFRTYAVSDYDGNLYHTVTIGTQTWLQENLRTTHYANGDPIVNLTNLNDWLTTSSGAYCWYNNDPEKGKVYGALYNWRVGADSRGLIIGFHTPLEADFLVISQLDTSNDANAGIMTMETGHEHWGTTRREATNSSGFTALPGGAIGPLPGASNFIFTELGESAYFWSNSGAGTIAEAVKIESKWCLFVPNYYYDIRFGFSLRLIK